MAQKVREVMTENVVSLPGSALAEISVAEGNN